LLIEMGLTGLVVRAIVSLLIVASALLLLYRTKQVFQEISASALSCLLPTYFVVLLHRDVNTTTKTLLGGLFIGPRPGWTTAHRRDPRLQ